MISSESRTISGLRRSSTPSAPVEKRNAATAAAGALLVEIVVVIGQTAGGRLSDEADVQRAFGSPQGIGELFLTDHLLAFEITSIVLLAAAVGGVVLGSEVRRREALER